MKIYIAEDGIGEYGGGILGVYSTRELAESAITLHNQGDVIEWEIDGDKFPEEFKNGLLPFIVTMKRDGALHPDFSTYRVSSRLDRLGWTVEAALTTPSQMKAS